MGEGIGDLKKAAVLALFLSVMGGLWVSNRESRLSGGHSVLREADSAAALNPQPSAKFVDLAQKGNDEFDKGEYKSAAEYYTDALALEPEQPSVLVDLGNCYYYSKDPDSALKYYNKALRVSPYYPNALYNKGVLLKDFKKDYRGARRAWEKFLEVQPNGEQAVKVRTMLGDLR